MQDNEILSLFEKDKDDAIAAVLEKYSGVLRSQAFGVLRDRGAAEECVNDVLLKVWESIPPCPENLPAYLRKVTRNAAINMYKKARAEKRGGGEVETILGELADCLPARAEEIDAGLRLKELLDGFLGSLSAEERRIFLYRYFDCLTVKEVAERLGSSESRIKMKLLRTRKKLEKHLEREGISI